jgi:hypothetical protein
LLVGQPPQRFWHTHRKKTRAHHKKQTPNQFGHSTILETGLAYFFYRPSVEVAGEGREMRGQADVARFYLLLSPKLLGPSINSAQDWLTASSSKDTTLYNKRLIQIPKKKLPDIPTHERLLGIVDKVSPNLHEIRSYLEGADTRSNEGGGAVPRYAQVRPVAEGVYALLEHESHTHLVYVLELPTEPGQVQDAFNLKKEGSYIILVKTPSPLPAEAPSTDDLVNKDIPLPEKPKEPTQILHSTVPFSPVTSPDLLDREGSAVLLVGAAEGLEEELGMTGKLTKDIQQLDLRPHRDDKLFQELHLHRKEHFKDPLTSGVWV